MKAISALVSYVMGLGLMQGIYDPVVDCAVGLTMIGVALVYAFRASGRGLRRREGADSQRAPDYRMIWVHGLAAAFGGDFFIVLFLAVALYTLTNIPTFTVGLLFGIGTAIGQLPVVLGIYRGMRSAVRSPELLVKAGQLSLLFLGVFMVGLGVYGCM